MKLTMLLSAMLLTTGCGAIQPALKALSGGSGGSGAAPRTEVKVIVASNAGDGSASAQPDHDKPARTSHAAAVAGGLFGGALLGGVTGWHTCYGVAHCPQSRRTVEGALIGAGVGALTGLIYAELKD